MTNKNKPIIKNLADTIRGKLKGSRIYGKPVDEKDTDQLIIAAYYAGIVDADVSLDKRIKEVTK